ncbi:MAG: YdbH domain-containing protein [Hyphomonadaceae bacterium]|nr:YdbH domain-containing protein [Hyphomonadaceae bacterium]
MPHTSNQDLASQEQTPSAEADSTSARRLLIGWATALAALGVSSALVAGAVWLLRKPLAEFVLEAVLSDRGVPADFNVTALDFSGLTLTDVRVGEGATPDAAMRAVDATWEWRGLSPRLARVRITAPELRLRLDSAGHVSAGALDHFERGTPSRRRPSIPNIGLEIVDGVIVLDAPFGALQASVRSQGVIGEDFAAEIRLDETTRAGTTHALNRASGEVVALAQGENVDVRITANAAGLTWAGVSLGDASLRVDARTPLDLATVEAQASWFAAALSAPQIEARALSGGAEGSAQMRDDALEIAGWRVDANANAERVARSDTTLNAARATARAMGQGADARAQWTLGADRFESNGVASRQAAARGHVFLSDAGVRGDALITLAQAALTPRARQRLLDAIPAASGSPVGPTLAAAEQALDRAFASFTLVAPLTFALSDANFRISLVTPAEARAASGARVRLAPLREDSPGLVLQWPANAEHPVLFGAVDLTLAGGGAPRASLLLDTVSWTAAVSQFEADGTLSLADWQADGARIAADDLGVTIALRPNDSSVELNGPLAVTGPLGDGEVRNLVAQLDVTARWNEAGWRVTPTSGCIPLRVDGVSAAGLAFQNGAFALCPLDGALIAADARRNLSGGFTVQRLSLTGSMAAEGAQVAQLNASNIAGRFRGRVGDLTLSLSAATPTLAIAMGEQRTLAVSVRRITADAHLAESWRVDGRFERGTLSDPALPGSVSAIEGQWNAQPEDGAAVIRVAAGEAVLTANRPASEAERPLFNPLRLVSVDATVRDGAITAAGDILLADTAQQLARFNAEHAVAEGVGAANVLSERIEFNETLRPYDISERTRGLVDNVRGPASVAATIRWTRDEIAAVGRVALDGVSLATATIPIVNDVRGEVFFDDLFALTTPPSQSVTVGLLNPGVAVRDGRVQFQLLADQHVAIESASFNFAGGVVAMAPTAIRLGADETRFELRLRSVDAAELLANLEIPDLAATGRVEGEFPLLLTRRTAFIENGVLRAEAGGGLISYTGEAGQSATGAARLAFDALRSFRYDELTLRLDGDLNGEVVSSIEFSGENRGEPIDLAALSDVPGVGRVTVRGVPFDFNVRITAPFRSLARTAASITDPGVILDRAREAAEPEEPPEPVANPAPQPDNTAFSPSS